MNTTSEYQSERIRLDSEFKKLKEKIKALGLDKPMPIPVLIQYFLLASMTIGFAIAAMQQDSFIMMFIFCVISSFSAVGLSTSSHSCSHISVTGVRFIDKSLTMLGFSYILGFSFSFWQYKHVYVHHANPNNQEYDNDIRIGPLFAVTETDRKNATGFYRQFHKIQFLIIPFAISLNIIGSQIKGYKYLFLKILSNKSTVLDWVDLVSLTLHFISWLVLPLLFFPLEAVLTVYILRSMINGYFGFITFAPAHFPKEAVCMEKEGVDLGHVRRQVYGSINFRTGWIGSLLCQGVEYQIEHHLIPNVCHLNYPKISVLVQEFCQQNQLPYQTLGWWEGIYKSLLVFKTPKKVLSNEEAILLCTTKAKSQKTLYMPQPNSNQEIMANAIS
jgi:fatty acid desaturase